MHILNRNPHSICHHLGKGRVAALTNLRFTRLEQENAKVPSKMLVPIVLCIVPAVFITVLVPIILSIKDVGLFKLILEKGIW
jgi:hypothetical protein